MKHKVRYHILFNKRKNLWQIKSGGLRKRALKNFSVKRDAVHFGKEIVAHAENERELVVHNK